MDFRECFLRKFHISREMLLEVINNHKCLVQVIKPAVELVVDSASRQTEGWFRPSADAGVTWLKVKALTLATLGQLSFSSLPDDRLGWPGSVSKSTGGEQLMVTAPHTSFLIFPIA